MKSGKFIAVILCCGVVSAMGPVARGEESLRVTVPAAVEGRTESAMSVRPTTKIGLALGVSSWRPSGLSLPNYAGSATSLSTNGMPLVQGTMMIPAFRVRSMSFLIATGLGFMSVRRDAKVAFSGVERDVSQSISLLSAQIGLEGQPEALRWKRGFAHFGLSANPTMAVAARSMLSDSVTLTSVPAEISVGSFVGLNVFGRMLPDSGVDLSLSQTLASGDTIQGNGTAVKAAFRFLM